MAKKNDWQLQGSYFETCNCEAACPCVWLQSPSEGDCKLLVAWHITNGYFEKQSLTNLNVALACYAHGDMSEGKWQAALYIDERADAAQFDAIVQIYSGQQGGHLAILMGFVSDVLGVKKVKIEYKEERMSVCLNHCRSPFSFLLNAWLNGKPGAFCMRIIHGTICLGCCWAQMLIMFAVGVMSVSAMIFLTLFILLEKRLPVNERFISKIAGCLLCFWGVVLIYSI